MLTAKKQTNKRIKVSVRAGFGTKLSSQFLLGQINHFSAQELAVRVAEKNRVSSDPVKKQTAQTLTGILEDPTSDVDMRVRTSKGVVSMPQSRFGEEKIETVLEGNRVNLEELNELEISASRIARGGF